MKPSISGVNAAPAPAAEIPTTACTNNGRYIVAPYMPPATRKVATTETAKIRFLNRLGLMIGSATRLSMTKNATQATSDQASSPSTGAEAQGYSEPAHEKASSMGTAAATSVAAPR